MALEPFIQNWAYSNLYVYDSKECTTHLFIKNWEDDVGVACADCARAKSGETRSFTCRALTTSSHCSSRGNKFMAGLLLCRF